MSEDGITGRDNHIIVKALFYAAHFIDGVPEVHREVSDRSDMMRILRSQLGDNFLSTAETYGKSLEEMTGRPFDVEEY